MLAVSGPDISTGKIHLDYSRLFLPRRRSGARLHTPLDQVEDHS